MNRFIRPEVIAAIWAALHPSTAPEIFRYQFGCNLVRLRLRTEVKE